jgi:hypothetical protein
VTEPELIRDLLARLVRLRDALEVGETRFAEEIASDLEEELRAALAEAS